MKRSEYLKDSMARLRAKLALTNSGGWALFLEEQVDAWELQAFEDWKKTPCEESHDILWQQTRATIADEVRAWANPFNLRQELVAAEENLREIEHGEAQDEIIDDSSQPPRNEKLTFLKRLKEKVTKKVL